MNEIPRFLTIGLTMCLSAQSALPASSAESVSIEPAAPGPASVLVTCGHTTIRIDGPKMWTMSRIAYRGEILGIEDSAYGSVFGFPGENVLIGTAHVYNGEKEQVTSVQYELDGENLLHPPETISGREFRLVKVSTIRNIRLNTTIELKNDHLFETVDVRCDGATPLALAYHFMHAWNPDMTNFIAARDGEAEMGDSLRDDPEVDRKFYIVKPVDWMSLYNPKTGKGIVSRLLQTPEPRVDFSQIWNVPKIYRKYYFNASNNQTLPAGFNGQYRMVTTFFSARSSAWKTRARKIATELERFK